LYLLVFLIGHYIAALGVYLNHRFLFHGRLGKLPILKYFKRLHANHHKHAYDSQRNDFFEPWWVKAVFIAIILTSSMVIGIAFPLGVLSFGLIYAYRHKRIHNRDRTSHFALYHYYHHSVDLRTNYSGVYPFIDHLFGTASYLKLRKERAKL